MVPETSRVQKLYAGLMPKVKLPERICLFFYLKAYTPDRDAFFRMLKPFDRGVLSVLRREQMTALPLKMLFLSVNGRESRTCCGCI